MRETKIEIKKMKTSTSDLMINIDAMEIISKRHYLKPSEIAVLPAVIERLAMRFKRSIQYICETSVKDSEFSNEVATVCKAVAS
jgi:hypothetical protein